MQEEKPEWPLIFSKNAFAGASHTKTLIDTFLQTPFRTIPLTISCFASEIKSVKKSLLSLGLALP